MQHKRILHLGPKSFGEAVVGLGPQLAQVVERIGDLLPDLQWYGADIDGTGTTFVPHTPTPLYVGDTDTLVRAAQSVNQFTSGVFAGVPAGVTNPRFREGGLWTDDDDAAELGDAVVEVRAFDTTYISVAATSEELLAGLEAEFATY